MSAVGRSSGNDDHAVRLPHELLAQIDARAAAAGMSREEAVARLLHRALATGPGDGVDRTQIAHRLRMTPAERVEAMATEVGRLLALTRRA
jgi:hypothetical protein